VNGCGRGKEEGYTHHCASQDSVYSWITNLSTQNRAFYASLSWNRKKLTLKFICFLEGCKGLAKQKVLFAYAKQLSNENYICFAKNSLITQSYNIKQ
jgi:hypothetical protein